jgi:hypothetical protein
MSLKPLIALTHIPKCAGSSFRESLINPNFSDDEIYRPKSLKEFVFNRSDFRYLVGHWPAGILNYLNPRSLARRRPQIRIVVLREPLDQLISYYYFHRQKEVGSPWSEDFHKYDIIEFYRRHSQLARQQTAFIAGMMLGYPKSPFKGLSEILPSFLLARAKKSLLTHFDYVTTTESSHLDFPELARRECMEYRARICRETQTRKRPKVEELSKKEIRDLRKLSFLDSTVYDLGRRQRDKIFG